MPLSAQILAVLAGLIHVYFFYLESIAWTKPSTWKVFGLRTQEEAEITKSLALNQGYYNLFLAIGVIVGVILDEAVPDGPVYSYGDAEAWWLELGYFYWGGYVVTFALASMLGAALVLLISSKGRMLRGAMIQGLLPLAALVILAVA